MSGQPENPQAFPVASDGAVQPGMTLHDWYVGQAVAPLTTWALSSPAFVVRNDGNVDEIIAKMSHEIADALLAERAKAGAL